MSGVLAFLQKLVIGAGLARRAASADQNHDLRPSR
jgi:hypothetical protein